MTPEEKKRLKRDMMIRLGLFVGFKVATAYILHRWSKTIGDTDETVIDETAEWFTNPYTTKIADGSLGGMIKVNFDW